MIKKDSKILIVDDDELVSLHLNMLLNSYSWNDTIVCLDSNKVMDILAREEICLVLLDLVMPHLSGEELLLLIKERYPELPVIITSCLNEVETAVRCLQYQAYDYLVKPIDENRLVKSIERALEVYELKNQVDQLKKYLLKEEPAKFENFSKIITRSKAMNGIFQYIETIAPTSQPVLITGETGVGKELIAEAIHKSSGRIGNYVTINIAGLDDTVFSDTLFGHQPGAFTGAVGTREGMVKKAADGTLFLDEIGDLNGELQVKLLRLMQEREYYPLGSDTAHRSKARIIVATNKNLKEMVDQKLFRSDLYFRLVSHQINIIPLKERKEDIPLLVDFYVEIIAKEIEQKKPQIPDELFFYLNNYQFPGNIRELKSILYDAVAHQKNGVLCVDRVKKYLDENGVKSYQLINTATLIGKPEELEVIPTVKEMTKKLVESAIVKCHGNQSAAADLIGITRQTLARYLKES